MFKVIKEDTKSGAIRNKAFYEMTKRILEIMRKLEITNSFSTTNYGVVVAQTEVILTAIGIIEDTINEHIDDYIDKE